jgi:signal peptidase I
MADLMDSSLLGSLVGLALYFALVLWMLLDSVRRGRGWVRWQALLYFLKVFAALVWLWRRRRWPVTVDIGRTRTLKCAALAAGIVVATFTVSAVVTTQFFQMARVEGRAMSPTLNNQDRVVVNKRVYRVGDPAIGDIVMLRYPRDPRKTFVMRVIAIGGDEVRMVDGVVFRNGAPEDESYVLEANRSHDAWGQETVPHGTYFVLGDRRNGSSDSREWGFVPREYVLGRVTTRWWPLSARRRFQS